MVNIRMYSPKTYSFHVENIRPTIRNKDGLFLFCFAVVQLLGV